MDNFFFFLGWGSRLGLGNCEGGGSQTFVTVVPARKKVHRRLKKTAHGWIAWMIAVRAATAMPAEVRELWEWAR